MKNDNPRAARVVYRNLAFIWLFNMVWALGSPMVNSATMVASFFDKLGSKPVLFGLLQVCASLPVLIQFLPRLVRLRKGNLKTRMITAYVLTGVGYICYGIAAHYCMTNPTVYVPVMLALYFLVFCLYQLGVILYLDYIMQLFPAEILGRFYGINGLFISAGAVAGSAVAGFILKAVGFPANYGDLFTLAGLVFILSTVLPMFSIQSMEAPQQSTVPGIKAYVSGVKGIFRQPAAKWFAVLILLIYINMASYGFALIFLNRELKMDVDPTVATVISYVSQSVLLLAVGICLDRLGRIKTICGYMTLAMAANVIILLPFKYSYMVVFATYGMYALFINMVKVRLVNEVVPADKRLDAVIVANVIGVVAGSLLSLAYGWIAGLIGSYRFIFMLSAASVVLVYIVAARLYKEIEKSKEGIQHDSAMIAEELQ